jgi:serine/threonine-protein kinase
LLRKSPSATRKLDDTTIQGLEEQQEDSAVKRFKETGQIVSKDFAGFTIVDKLGQGGTATVYRALEPVNLKPVALKVISPFAAVKDGFLKRLERSNAISVKLMHPHIVRTYTMGEYQNVHFMVQEVVEGAPLDRFIDSETEKLTEKRARHFMLHVAMALDYLDQHKLLHRDVKPGNIYVNQDDVAKLGDFGLTRLVEDTAQTAEGYLLGTPHYISPEQAGGQKDVDSRADIYSLGATFYHLLAHQPLFPGDNLQQVVLAHLTKDAPPLNTLAASVSPEFCALIDRTVKRDRKERFVKPGELIAALNALPALAA